MDLLSTRWGRRSKCEDTKEFSLMYRFRSKQSLKRKKKSEPVIRPCLQLFKTTLKRWSDQSVASRWALARSNIHLKIRSIMLKLYPQGHAALCASESIDKLYIMRSKHCTFRLDRTKRLHPSLAMNDSAGDPPKTSIYRAQLECSFLLLYP